MPSRTSGTVPRGPALTFDPRYVDFLLDTWKSHSFDVMPLDALITEATTRAEDALDKLTSMGLRSESASSTKTKGIVTLLKSLKLIKQTTTGPKGAKIAMLQMTPSGRVVLPESPGTGGIRVGLVRQLVAQSSTLSALLGALDEQGPLRRPVLSRQPGSPSRGAPYVQAIEDGVAQFWSTLLSGTHQTRPLSSGASKRKPTPAQILAAAQASAFTHHLAGSLPRLDQLVPLAQALGLLWAASDQINSVLATSAIGSAAVKTAEGYAPNTPTWEEIGTIFLNQLVQAHRAHADSTGFASIDAIRGALGKLLHLSPTVVDALLCQARAFGDHGNGPVVLHFEEDEERISDRTRVPLQWQGRLYDFIEVRGVEVYTPTFHS